MQHQQPYTVSFLRWQSNSGQPDKPQVEAWKEQDVQGVLVTFESTRSKKTAFKTRLSWDESASTYLTVDSEVPKDQDFNIFWLCMDYALVGAICTENRFEECVGRGGDHDFGDSWSWFESLPKPWELTEKPRHMHYFRLLQEAFPEAEFKLIDNGFHTHHYYN